MSSDPLELVADYQRWDTDRADLSEYDENNVKRWESSDQEALNLLDRMAGRWLPLQRVLADAAAALSVPDMESTWTSMSCREVESLRHLFEADHLETAHSIIAGHQTGDEDGDLHWFEPENKVIDWRDGREATVIAVNTDNAEWGVIVHYFDDPEDQNTATSGAWFHNNEEAWR